MYIEFPYGEADSVDWDDWPEQCFLLCYATFPFANDEFSYPATLISPKGTDLEVIDFLDSEIERVIAKTLTDETPDELLNSISEELETLLRSISSESKFADGELECDSYVDLAAYKEYLSEVVIRSPTFMIETHGEDEGAPPDCKSCYRLHWDSEPSQASLRFIKEINNDITLLRT